MRSNPKLLGLTVIVAECKGDAKRTVCRTPRALSREALESVDIGKSSPGSFAQEWSVLEPAGHSLREPLKNAEL